MVSEQQAAGGGAFGGLGQGNVDSLHQRGNRQQPQPPPHGRRAKRKASVQGFAALGGAHVQSLAAMQRDMAAMAGPEGEARKAGRGRFGRVGRWLAQLDGTMPAFNKWAMAQHWGVNLALNAVPRGIGQVTFINNPVSGALIFLALALWHPDMAWVGLAGIFASNGMAIVMGFDNNLLTAGIFGYNGVLCAMALVVFLDWPPHDASTWTLLLSYVGLVSSLSTVVTVAMANAMAPVFKIPPLTFPFSIVTLFALVAARAFPRFPVAAALQPSPFEDTGAATLRLDGADVTASQWEWGEAVDPNHLSASDVLLGGLRGVAQVFLSDSAVVGGLILGAMAVSSRIAAACSLLGSFVGLGAALGLGASDDAIRNGIWGYCGALSAVAVGGVFYVPGLKATVVAAYTAAVSSFVQAAFVALLAPYGVPTMSFGFCVATTFITLLQRSASALVPVSLSDITTPEGHWRKLREVSRQASFHKNGVGSPKGTNKDKAKAKDKPAPDRSGLISPKVVYPDGRLGSLGAAPAKADLRGIGIVESNQESQRDSGPEPDAHHHDGNGGDSKPPHNTLAEADLAV